MDLYTLARLKLAEAGVRSVSGGGFCTLTDRERIFLPIAGTASPGAWPALIWFDQSLSRRLQSD